MFTVTINGHQVQCETVADVIELTRQAGNSSEAATHKPPHSAAAATAGSRWTEQRVKEFFKIIKAPQKKLVEALLETPDARTGDQLCTALGIKDGVQLAGVFTGLWKNAKKVGADPKELYQRNQVTIGDKRQYEYTLTQAFRQAARWKS